MRTNFTRLFFLLQKSFLLLVILSLSSAKLKAADYYWIGGSGNWSDLSHWATTSGGSTVYTQIPTAVDDVYFDANSFTAPGQTVNFDPLTILAHNISWTGVTNNPALTGASANLLKLYGSLTFAAGMTMNFPGQISFEATSAGKTITTAGKTLAGAAFNGIGGSWTLQDAFTVTGNISLNNGTLITNNKTVNASNFSSVSGNTRSLQMGSSVFNLSGNWSCSITGLTLNCGTSVINCSSIIGTFTGGGFTYYDVNFTSALPSSLVTVMDNNTFHDVVFSSGAVINQNNTFHNVSVAGDGETKGNNTFNNLSFSPGHTYIFGVNTTQTITGIFSATGGCGELIDIHSKNAGNPATISHPAGNVTIAYSILKDITATGSANFTASNSVDLGNNTGWTINAATAQNLYWIGGSGNWDNGNHWSFTSGGAPSGCSPTPVDNVFFDANSFTTTGQTVLINVLTAYCRDMTWTGAANNPTLAGTSSAILKIYGSLTFTNAMTMNYGGQVRFEAVTPGKTITMAAKSFNELVTFAGIGGSWTLQDAFSTARRISLEHGVLNTNNKTVNAVEFYSVVPPAPTARGLNMGSSVFNISGSADCWNVQSSGITLNCGTSVINCISFAPNFLGGNLTYYDLNFTLNTPGAQGKIFDTNIFHDVVFAAKGTLLQSNNFHNLTFLGDGEFNNNNTCNDLTFSAGHTYVLNAGKTQSVSGSFIANGNCGAYIDIHSNDPGSQAMISHSAGNVNTSFLILKDMKTVGGGTFNAVNSVDFGNNTGWNFTSPSPRNLYWIGNSGNWDNGNHWSLTSGGVPSGCSPSPLDNVFFDANSFSSAGQVVTVNVPAAYCRDMTWTGVTNTPSFAGPVLNLLKIYGSLKFVSGMNMNFAGKVYFEGNTTGKTITMGGRSFLNNVDFNGIGSSWTLQDVFTTTSRVTLNNGTLTTNNKTFNAQEFYSPTPVATVITRALNMGSSVFNISGSFSCWYVNSTGFTLNCGTSVINCTAPNGGPIFEGGALSYYDLNFTGTGSSSSGTIVSANHFHDVFFAADASVVHSNTFNNVTISGDGNIQSSNTYHDLFFTAGHDYKISSASTQDIANRWQVQGSCTSYIVLESSVPGSPAFFTKSSGSVLGYNIHIKDIRCIGGATFIAYNSVDLGGNAGWNFSFLPPLLNPGLITGPSQVCPNATGVIYHIPPVTGAISYQWTVPPGATITNGQGDTIIVVSFGPVISGSIVVQSFNGCNYGTISSAFTLTAAALPVPVVTLSANPNTAVCPGTAVTFTAAATNTGGGTVTYNFKVNGNILQTGISNIFSHSSLVNNDIVSCDISVSSTTCSAIVTAESNLITVAVKQNNAPGTENASVCSNDLPYIWKGNAYSAAGTYTATLNGSNGCDSLVTLHLSVLPGGMSGCVCVPKIPNAITPNGDGTNDKWVISYENCVRRVSVSVYNRYGNLVYHSDDYQNDWEGTYKLKPCPDGTYYYIIQTINPVRNRIYEQVIRGNITILR